MRSQHQPNSIIIYTKHTINIQDRNTTQCNEIVKICKFLEHTKNITHHQIAHIKSENVEKITSKNEN